MYGSVYFVTQLNYIRTYIFFKDEAINSRANGICFKKPFVPPKHSSADKVGNIVIYVASFVS